MKKLGTLCTNKQCRMRKTCERYVSSVRTARNLHIYPHLIYWARLMPEKDKLRCSYYIKKEKVRIETQGEKKCK